MSIIAKLLTFVHQLFNTIESKNQTSLMQREVYKYMINKQVILIVDDQPINLSMLSQLLSDKYQVRVANSGERALDVVKTKPQPDLILLDIMMPNMDGYAVLSLLKSDTSTQRIPVIFVTAMDAQ